MLNPTPALPESWLAGHSFARLTGALSRPFEYAELNWKWARRLGYLVAGIARKRPMP